MAQVKIIRESQQYFAKQDTPSLTIHVKFHQNLTSILRKCPHKNAAGLALPGQEKERRTTGETLRPTLTLCDANYAMKKIHDVEVTRQ